MPTVSLVSQLHSSRARPIVRVDGVDHPITITPAGLVLHAGVTVGAVIHYSAHGTLHTDAMRPDGTGAGTYRSGPHAAVALIRHHLSQEETP